MNTISSHFSLCVLGIAFVACGPPKGNKACDSKGTFGAPWSDLGLSGDGADVCKSTESELQMYKEAKGKPSDPFGAFEEVSKSLEGKGFTSTGSSPQALGKGDDAFATVEGTFKKGSELITVHVGNFPRCCWKNDPVEIHLTRSK